jgi:hypothetical protein
VLFPLAVVALPLRLAPEFWKVSGGWELAIPFLLFLPSTALAGIQRASIVRALDRAYQQRSPTIWDASGAALRRIWAVVTTEFLQILLFIPTVIAFPYFWVRWNFVQQAVMIDGKTGWGAIRASARAVHGHWAHTAGILLAVYGLSVTPTLVDWLVVTNDSIWTALLFALIGAHVLALAVSAESLLYYDLKRLQHAALR